MISRDESRYALEFEDMYLIQPVHPWWQVHEYPEARPMKDGAKYSSDRNDWWLSRDDLAKILEE